MNAVNATVALQEASEWLIYGRVIFAFLFVVALIYLVSAFARKYGLDKRLSGVKGAEKTLSITETLYLDPRRRIVVVRAGKKEHLLLLTPTRDLMIASHDVEVAHENK